MARNYFADSSALVKRHVAESAVVGFHKLPTRKQETRLSFRV